MFSRYILMFFIFITYLNANIGSECMDIEKKYYEKKLKNMNCNITEYTEKDDKNRCIEKKYTTFVRDIDDLFLVISEEIEDKELDFDVSESKVFCTLLKHRITAISRGDYGDKKKKELDKAKDEIKAKYHLRLLSSLIPINVEVPKKCVHSLKTFLDKRVNLKNSRFVEITKKSYYECLDRNLPKKIIEEKIVKVNESTDNKTIKVEAPLDNDFKRTEKGSLNLIMDYRQI